VLFRSPISIALYTNLAVTLCVVVIAICVAFLAVDRAVERAAREDISREIAIMLDRTSERNTIPDTAILTTNIGLPQKNWPIV
jgi:ABC-type Fe3+ transport system permease subunit